jgi:ribosome-associated protein
MSSTEHPSIPTRTGDEKRSTSHPPTVLAAAAVDAALDKKARDVVVMDVRGISGVADLFVICTGDSDIQIKAIAESVREEIRSRYGEKPWHVEGMDHLKWVLLDYVDVVVHVFAEDRRSFYDLERLWGDAPIATVPTDGSSEDVPFLRDHPAASEEKGDES